MSEFFELDGSMLDEVIAAHLVTWEKTSLSVQLGPAFLKAFYELAIEDDQTMALGIRKSSNAPISSWCVGFRAYNSFNEKLKKRLGIRLHIMVLKKVLSGEISLAQLWDHFFGTPQDRAVKNPDSHLGAFGCVGKNFEDVLLLTNLIQYTAGELCKHEPSCWAVTNETNKGGKLVMKRADFSRIDTIQAKDRTLGIYEFFPTT